MAKKPSRSKKTKTTRRYVNVECSTLTDRGIKIIEKKMNARYVFESCVRVKGGGWSGAPVAVFYQDKVHPRGSHYFGIYKENEYPGVPGRTMICDAKSATDDEFIGIMADNGEVIYSRHVHDYRNSQDRSVWIDGGRDYTRHGSGQLVRLKVVKDKVKIVGEEKP